MKYQEIKTEAAAGQNVKIEERVSLYELKAKKVKNTSFERVKITCSKDGFNYAQKFYQCDINIYESFFLLALDASNSTIGWAKISQGNINATLVDSRILLKFALDLCAVSAMVIHNHPSGNKQASESDKKLTRKLQDQFALLDINLLDHLILVDNDYLSFADQGLM